MGHSVSRTRLVRNLSDKLGHLRLEMREVDLLQHQNARPRVLRQSKQVVSASFEDLKTQG
mgnify:CR=1 FL=1